MTRNEIETALDQGRLFAHVSNGNWWKLRRNGQTQTWKRDPDRFRIPVKAGLKSCGEITNENMTDSNLWQIR